MIASPAWFSEVGTRSANEDSCAFWWVGRTLFAAIADGLGGMGGGGCASRYAVESLRRQAGVAGITRGQLADQVRQSHAGLRQLQQCLPEHRSMATTLTVMALRGRQLLAAHCGDTRLYLVGSGRARQLTEDHSEVQRLVNEGRLSRSELSTHPRRHILESALGIPGMLVVQEIRCRVGPGDWLVLASDGAHDRLDTGDLCDMADVSRRPRQFAEACRCLIESRQPRDNYSMVVVRVGGILRRALPWRTAGGNA